MRVGQGSDIPGNCYAMFSERRSPVRVFCAWLTALAVAWCSVTSQGRALDVAADHEHGMHLGLHHHHHGHDHDSGSAGGTLHEDSATVVAHVHMTGCLPTSVVLPGFEGKLVQEAWDVPIVLLEVFDEFDRPPKRI